MICFYQGRGVKARKTRGMEDGMQTNGKQGGRIDIKEK